MLITKAARRYARALLEASKETDSVEQTLEDVKLINNTLEGSNELVLFLQSPVVKFDDKAEALNTIFGDKVQKLTARFLDLLAQKSRINLLDQVGKAFIEAYNKHAGILEVDVYTARKLPADQKKDLQHALEQQTGKNITMTVSIDESLQGGIAVRIGDTVYDGTVKHMLEELKQEFTSTATT